MSEIIDEQLIAAPFVGPIVQIVDRETGAELGLVPVASLRPL